MSSMDKMWASFIAIGLMVAASLIVSFARYKVKHRLFRVLLTILSVILLLYALVFMFASLV